MGFKRIKLPKGKVALVDVEDYERLLSITEFWYCNTIQGIDYARAHIPGSGHPGTKLFMHRVILKAKKGVSVDHINGNGLDNRKKNLRFATRAENNWNRHKPTKTISGFKGVYFNRQRNLWRALLQANGKRIELGNYKNPVDAAKAYDKGAKKYHGDFAKLNFR